ncbi:MAG: L-threonylcarbamoyladenylate synthase [Luteibaculaceae bacterium]
MIKIGTKIEKAVEILNKGGLVAIPTETVYGLAANALNKDAVAKIFAAKNRPSFDPLIIHVAQFSQFKDYCKRIPELAELLSKAFHPGPLTLILEKKELVPDLVTSGQNTVGIRIPGHSTTLELLERLKFPLAAPSANPFGYISPTTAQHVADQLNHAVDYILDGGPCSLGIESTIVRVVNDEYEVLRLGGISLEVLEKVTGKKPSSVLLSSDNPAAPGMLSAHYAPRTPVVLIDKNSDLSAYNLQEAAFIGFSALRDDIPQENQFILSPKADFNEAAVNLFAYLRNAERLSVRWIFAELLPEESLGRAINDRLKRAAAK